MNDVEFEEQKARVEALYERWVKPIGLAWLHWALDWHRGPIPDATDAMFLISVRFEYHEILLQIDLTRVAKDSDEDLERHFCHELGHVFTIPIKAAAARRLDSDGMHMIEEHQASMIGSALLWLRASLTHDDTTIKTEGM